MKVLGGLGGMQTPHIFREGQVPLGARGVGGPRAERDGLLLYR